MKNKLFFVAFAAFVFCSLSFKSADYFNYKSEAGRYKIDFPTKPEESSQEVETALGKVTMYMAILDASKDEKALNGVYLTTYVDYDSLKYESMTSETLDSFYEGALSGSIKNVQGKLISKKDFTSNGVKGIIADVDYQDGVAVIRLKYLLVKNRLYMMETVTETAKLNNEQQNHFFDSFKVIE